METAAVASVKMPIGENWTVNRSRYSSEDGAGKRVCLVTGIHGDERMGQLVLYDVAQRIKKAPQHLHGMIDLYPMLNPIGLDIGERMVPSATMQNMNRAFPGSESGTALESICFSIVKDMKDADLVLDIHTSSQITSEVYGVRVHEKNAETMIPAAASLCPQTIWMLADKAPYNATLTGALTQEGTPAMILMVDERRLRSQMIVDEVVDGIFCKLSEMGMWTGEVKAASEKDSIPCMQDAEDVCRVTCTHPGMYVPREVIGEFVNEGDVLGTIFNALEGEPVETVIAPKSGLVFTQRRYSGVYPGTLIARICRKERT